MENFEFCRYEISKIYFDGQLVDYIDAVMTVTFVNNPHNMSLPRSEIISYIKKGDGFYLQGKKLIVETIDGKPYIHIEPSAIAVDLVD